MSRLVEILAGRAFTPLMLPAMRAAAGLSQSELARRTGYSQQYISGLESGAKDGGHWTTARNLAEACGFRLALAWAGDDLTDDKERGGENVAHEERQG